MFAKIAGCNDIDRFWSKVAKKEASLCWEWNGTSWGDMKSLKQALG